MAACIRFLCPSDCDVAVQAARNTPQIGGGSDHRCCPAANVWPVRRASKAFALKIPHGPGPILPSLLKVSFGSLLLSCCYSSLTHLGSWLPLETLTRQKSPIFHLRAALSLHPATVSATPTSEREGHTAHAPSVGISAP